MGGRRPAEEKPARPRQVETARLRGATGYLPLGSVAGLVRLWPSRLDLVRTGATTLGPVIGCEGAGRGLLGDREASPQEARIAAPARTRRAAGTRSRAAALPCRRATRRRAGIARGRGPGWRSSATSAEPLPRSDGSVPRDRRARLCRASSLREECERDSGHESGSIGVVGAGAWGTALAIVAARAGHEACSVGPRPGADRSAWRPTRENARYLPGMTCPTPCCRRRTLGDAGRGRYRVAGGALRSCCAPAGRALPGRGAAGDCAKGLERATGLRLSQVVAGRAAAAAVAALSGPSFALEVAQGLPTAVTDRRE